MPQQKITFTQDVEVEGSPVKAGTYAMYTIPDRNTWEVMLYTDLKLGGKVAEYNKENEVLHVIVKPIRIPMKIETLTWNLGNVEPSSAVITMLWENVFLPIKITTKIDDQVMKNIEASMKSDEPDYFRAAGYYFENDKDLKQALEWVNKAVELNPTAYYMMFLKAKIEYKMGDKKAGNASAENTIALAEEAKNADYVALASKLLEANK
jgi:tetratricopeptide (TPR) repeat protein